MRNVTGVASDVRGGFTVPKPTSADSTRAQADSARGKRSVRTPYDSTKGKAAPGKVAPGKVPAKVPTDSTGRPVKPRP